MENWLSNALIRKYLVTNGLHEIGWFIEYWGIKLHLWWPLPYSLTNRDHCWVKSLLIRLCPDKIHLGHAWHGMEIDQEENGMRIQNARASSSTESSKPTWTLSIYIAQIHKIWTILKREKD